MADVSRVVGAVAKGAGKASKPKKPKGKNCRWVCDDPDKKPKGSYSSKHKKKSTIKKEEPSQQAVPMFRSSNL